MAGVVDSADGGDDELERLLQEEKVLKAFIKKLENQKERLEIEESDLVNKIKWVLSFDPKGSHTSALTS